MTGVNLEDFFLASFGQKPLALGSTALCIPLFLVEEAYEASFELCIFFSSSCPPH
jgi:hypothetical protein